MPKAGENRRPGIAAAPPKERVLNWSEISARFRTPTKLRAVTCLIEGNWNAML
jgi:hypothetical protein